MVPSVVYRTNESRKEQTLEWRLEQSYAVAGALTLAPAPASTSANCQPQGSENPYERYTSDGGHRDVRPQAQGLYDRYRHRRLTQAPGFKHRQVPNHHRDFSHACWQGGSKSTTPRRALSSLGEDGTKPSINQTFLTIGLSLGSRVVGSTLKQTIHEKYTTTIHETLHNQWWSSKHSRIAKSPPHRFDIGDDSINRPSTSSNLGGLEYSPYRYDLYPPNINFQNFTP